MGHDTTALARRIARAGWIAKGILFIVIGLIGVEIARRSSVAARDADQGGALATIAQAPLGRGLVAVMGVGLVLHAIWQLWSAISGGRPQPLDETLSFARRVGSLGVAAVYAMLGATALEAALAESPSPGGGGGGLTSPDGISTWLLDLPFGAALLAGVGAVTISVGVHHVHKGWGLTFLDDIDRSGLSDAAETVLAALGAVGNTARSVTLMIAGTLFIVAAWRHNPDDAAGLDETLRTLTEVPGGRPLLAAAAVGLMAAGLYDAVTFRRQRLDGMERA